MVNSLPAAIDERLQLRLDTDDGQAVVEAHGAVDMSTAPGLCAILKAAVQNPEMEIVLDLRPTTYLGGDGMRSLMDARQASPMPSAAFEVQVRAGSQPESALWEAGAHRHFSVVVWKKPAAREKPEMNHEVLELRIPADVYQVGRVRRLMEQVLTHVGADESWIGDFVLAVGEAVANAVTHGSPEDGPGYVIFSLKPGLAEVTAEIQDFGRGIQGWTGHGEMPGPDNLRGRGLGMMQIFADSVEIHTSGSGTLVRLQKQMCS